MASKKQPIPKVEKAVRAESDPVDVTAVLGVIEKTLDGAILAAPRVETSAGAKPIYWSQLDFEVLEMKLARGKTKNLEAAMLRALIEGKLIPDHERPPELH